MIRRGVCDAVIAGGSEAVVTQIGIGGFNAMKALSTRNDEPEKASRPWDKDRDGFVMGEGCRGAGDREPVPRPRSRCEDTRRDLRGMGRPQMRFILPNQKAKGR